MASTSCVPAVAFTPLIRTPAQAWQALANLDEPSFRENRRLCFLANLLSDQAQFEQSLYLLWRSEAECSPAWPCCKL